VVTRFVFTLVALLSSLGALDAGAMRPSKWPPPHCPTAHALVAYYVTDGSSFNNDLVIRLDRHASLCWGRHVNNRSGRENFLVSRLTIKALRFQLERIGRLRPPPPPRGADVRSASLVYRGRTIPANGYPKTRAGIRALRRAETMLDRIVARRTTLEAPASVAEVRSLPGP
jgi:hypothetical protein